MKALETAIRDALADGAWHSAHSICNAVSHLVPLESAMRQWRNKHPDQEPDEDKLPGIVIAAKRQRVTHAVTKLSFHLRHGKSLDRVEFRGPRGNREYRYVKAEETNATNN